MQKRREARIRALEILYQNEITDESIDNIISTQEKIGTVVSEFSKQLVGGVGKNLKEIDQQIAYASDRWTLDRMPMIDRNILRIATYELLFEKDIPLSVSINEAVEVAKEYGTPDSGKFVNGILGAIAGEIKDKE